MNGYIGLGSNLGDRLQNLKEAISLLGECPLVVSRCSSVFRSEALDLAEQPDFFNMAIGLHTDLPPLSLLDICLDVERKMGRKRIVAKGPRNIDLDVLLLGDRIIHCDRLILPHPRMHLRRFVLLPLDEIGTQQVHPVLQKTVHVLLQESKDFSRVEWYCDARLVAPNK